MKKKILILAANPSDTARLCVDRELREIIDILETRAALREEFSVIPRPAARLHDLRRTLTKEKPWLVHFAGHGEDKAGLVLEDDNGQPQHVNGEVLAELLKLFVDYVHCVVLNACYAEQLTEVIAEHVNTAYIVSMKDELYRHFLFLSICNINPPPCQGVFVFYSRFRPNEVQF